MSEIFWRESLGLFGSTLILVSMCFNSRTYKGTLLLRGINAFASAICMVYGFWIKSLSMSLLNIVCLILDIIYLIKAIKEEKKENVSG